MRIPQNLSVLAVVVLASATLAGCNFATAKTRANQDQAIASPAAPTPEEAAAQRAQAALEGQPTQQVQHLTGVDYVISRVIREDFRCAGSQVLNVSEAPGNPREFIVRSKDFNYQMVPTVVPSGAIRLENQAHKVIWLQVAGRAMLIDEGRSIRLANECIPFSRLAEHEAEQARAQAQAQAQAQQQAAKKTATKTNTKTSTKKKTTTTRKTQTKSNTKK